MARNKIMVEISSCNYCPNQDIYYSCKLTGLNFSDRKDTPRTVIPNWCPILKKEKNA